MDSTLDRIEGARRQLPEMARQVAQIVVDNPGQFLVIGAGMIVATRIMANLTRPRTAAEAAALLVVLEVGGAALAKQATDRHWLRFRVRDEAGQLVPYVPGADA